MHEFLEKEHKDVIDRAKHLSTSIQTQ
jgi:hypothetical protein